MRRHAPNVDAIRWTLSPFAAPDPPIAAPPPVIAAARTVPLDPATFVQIAGRMPEMPPALRNWIATRPTPCACATTTTILHTTFHSRSAAAHCAALTQTPALGRNERTPHRTATPRCNPTPIGWRTHRRTPTDGMPFAGGWNPHRSAVVRCAAVPPRTHHAGDGAQFYRTIGCEREAANGDASAQTHRCPDHRDTARRRALLHPSVTA